MAHAQTISRRLKAAGFVICSDRMHEGTLVQRSGLGVVVVVQNDSDRRAIAIANEVASVLFEMGYAVQINENRVYVK
jgi:hypothetical protein